MGQDKKRAYLEQIHKRYNKSSKRVKSLILDEFCEVCGYHRKHAITILTRPIRRRRKPKSTKKRGRKPLYNYPELVGALKAIWQASDYLCSKKLKVLITQWLPFYLQKHALSAQCQQHLLTISAASIDRLLKPARIQMRPKGLGGTKPGRLVKNQIPIRTGVWDEERPGFMEADTVAHCGQSLQGSFVWSLTMTDIASTWTENRATWNKGAQGVCDQVANIEEQLPFPLLGFDTDCGSEFLNHHFIRYFSDRPKNNIIEFTRSRPYHKNDNAYVEQKNWTHVRQVFGYQRFDQPQLVTLMNDLYANEWSLYQNHFIPTMKCIEKVKINSRYRKKYDIPQTPYQRLLASKHISEAQKAVLQRRHQELNPFELKKAIENKLNKIFSCVKVRSNYEATNVKSKTESKI